MSPVHGWMVKGLLMGLRIALLAYGGLVVLMALGQRQYIYFPVRASEADLFGLAGRMNLAPWRDPEGRVIGWRTRRALLEPPKYRVVIFHGNAGMALHRNYFVDGFGRVGEGLRWEVILFEYPGYGARPGKPTESAIKEAAVAAVKALLAEDDRPLYLVGESLGGGVATHVARQFPDRISGLLLVTPFNRLADVAAHHYPYLPVRWLLRERYDLQEDLAEYRGPVAVLLAGRDEVVPTRLGQKVYDSYQGPKRLWVQEGVTHNMLDVDPQSAWWGEVAGFWLGARP